MKLLDSLELCQQVFQALVSKGSEVQSISQIWLDKADDLLILGPIKDEYFEGLEKVIDAQQAILDKITAKIAELKEPPDSDDGSDWLDEDESDWYDYEDEFGD